MAVHRTGKTENKVRGGSKHRGKTLEGHRHAITSSTTHDAGMHRHELVVSASHDVQPDHRRDVILIYIAASSAVESFSRTSARPSAESHTHENANACRNLQVLHAGPGQYDENARKQKNETGMLLHLFQNFMRKK